MLHPKVLQFQAHVKISQIQVPNLKFNSDLESKQLRPSIQEDTSFEPNTSNISITPISLISSINYHNHIDHIIII